MKMEYVTRIIKSLALVTWIVVGMYFGMSGVVYADSIALRAKVRGVGSEIKTVTDIDTTVMKDSLAMGEQMYPLDAKPQTQVKYEIDGVRFSTLEAAEQWRDEENMLGLFIWLDDKPAGFILFITAIAMGGLGGAIGIVRNVSMFKQDLLHQRVLSLPLLGSLIGVMVLGISYLLPLVLTTDTNAEIRPTTLIFLSLFSGLFSKDFLKTLESRFTNYIKTDEN
jgi:hypothetical protein